MNSGISDHKCCNIYYPCYDFSRLEININANKWQQPKRNKNSHHIHNRISKHWYLKNCIFKWFEIELIWLYIFKQLFLGNLLRLPLFKFSLIISISLELRLDHIIFTITLLTRIGYHRRHWFDLKISLHFLSERFFYP